MYSRAYCAFTYVCMCVSVYVHVLVRAYAMVVLARIYSLKQSNNVAKADNHIHVFERLHTVQCTGSNIRYFRKLCDSNDTKYKKYK